MGSDLMSRNLAIFPGIGLGLDCAEGLVIRLVIGQAPLVRPQTGRSNRSIQYRKKFQELDMRA